MIKNHIKILNPEFLIESTQSAIFLLELYQAYIQSSLEKVQSKKNKPTLLKVDFFIVALELIIKCLRKYLAFIKKVLDFKSFFRNTKLEKNDIETSNVELFITSMEWLIHFLICSKLAIRDSLKKGESEKKMVENNLSLLKVHIVLVALEVIIQSLTEYVDCIKMFLENKKREKK